MIKSRENENETEQKEAFAIERINYSESCSLFPISASTDATSSPLIMYFNFLKFINSSCILTLNRTRGNCKIAFSCTNWEEQKKLFTMRKEKYTYPRYKINKGNELHLLRYMFIVPLQEANNLNSCFYTWRYNFKYTFQDLGRYLLLLKSFWQMKMAVNKQTLHILKKRL